MSARAARLRRSRVTRDRFGGWAVTGTDHTAPPCVEPAISHVLTGRSLQLAHSRFSHWLTSSTTTASCGWVESTASSSARKAGRSNSMPL